MGVLPCSRKGCDSILCDYTIDGEYICWQCARTLRTLKDTWPRDISRSAMLAMIKNWLGTRVHDDHGDDNRDEIFDDLLKSRHEDNDD